MKTLLILGAGTGGTMVATKNEVWEGMIRDMTPAVNGSDAPDSEGTCQYAGPCGLG